MQIASTPFRISILIGAVLVLFLAPLVGGEPLQWSSLLEPSTKSHLILFELRLPRFLVVVFAGASLAVLGAIYQILFSNPLAEPYLLGISSAVILGAAVGEVILLLPPMGWQTALLGTGAAALACSSILLVYWSSRQDAIYRVVLFGVGLQFVLSSFLFLLLSYYSDSIGGGSLRWLFGRIPWQDWNGALSFVALLTPFLGLSLIASRGLDALAQGDVLAQSLGFSPRRLRGIIIAVTSVWVAILVSVTGAIGFVGLIIPHGIRIAFRPSNSARLLLGCMVGGAAFLALSDSLSRAVSPPLEFPVGIITSLIGGPVFLFLLWRVRPSQT